MRSVSTVVRLALAAFAFGGCTGHNRVETFTQDRVGTFIYEGWILGFSSAKIREHLGAPIKVIAEPIENRNVPGQTDEIRDVLYPGLTPQFYVVNENPERELLSHISVTNGQYDVRGGLNVGAPKVSVRRYLGGGFERLDQAEARNRLFDQTLTCDTPDCAWVYTHPLDPGSEVVFTFQDERIKRIDWYIYTD